MTFASWLTRSLAVLALTSHFGGEGFRATLAGFSVNPRRGVYDRNYLRSMTNTGSAMSEQIELNDLLADSDQQRRES